MRYIADLHIHSHYSRATSKDLNLESLYCWAKVKGINVVGTGDFTHPEWFAELREKLEPDGNGFFMLKEPPKDPAIPGLKTQDIDVRFCLTTEISSIYKYGNRVRKNHNLVYAPDFNTVARINHKLSTIGNLEADGRPILGLPSRDLLEIVLETSDRAYLIPAHIWTPWFSTLGSKAGYDSIDACFRDLTEQLFAVETGLSSDPAMNRKLSILDRFTLISNSDAHSPSKLGREANVLNTELSYDGLFNAFKTGVGMLGTYEFYPEEGKYHHDGHRKCNIHLKPEETNRLHGLCPVCGKPLTVGVLNRVESLSDRTCARQPDRAADYDYIIPLPEVLGEIEGVGPKSKAVQEQFRQVISHFGNEFSLLRETPTKDIEKSGRPVLAEAVRRIRKNEVDPQGGFDGVFGVIRIFKDGEIERIRGQLGFFGLDDYKVEKNEQFVDPRVSFKAEKKSTQKQSPADLNKEQEKVRQSLTGATLVQAGPGTGKTHTLIEWLVHHVNSRHARPDELLAVTFTNKAADELRDRLGKRLGKQAESITVGTFHALAWKWLRQHYPDLHTIYDASARQMSLNILFPGLKETQINKLINLIACYLELNEPAPAQYRDYIKEYRAYAWEHGAIDLSDLIRRTTEILQKDDGWLQQIRNRNNTIAVDEIQDINPMQFQLINQIGAGQNILAIGDPAQAIYGFRGADVKLFFQFAEAFNANEINLVQNYRSTDVIIKSAGAVIQNNAHCSGMQLKAQKNSNQLIEIFQAASPFEEANYILEQIKYYVGGTDSLTTGTHTDSEHSYGLCDIAILFRTHNISHSLFKSFMKAGIPIHLGDGTAFLSEPPFNIISDFLHLYLQPENSVILGSLLVQAYDWDQHQIASLLTSLDRSNQSLFNDITIEMLSERHKEHIGHLKHTHHQLTDALKKDGVKAGVEIICERYLPAQESDESVVLKKETLLHLANDAGYNVETFLEQMQLNPYTDAGRLKIEGVHLLTFHAAKGLEFPVVFIAGTEEGVIPLQRDGVDIEEERRLFYVASTRAKEILHLSWSRKRSRYGVIEQMKPSRFIGEIPEKWKEYVQDTDGGSTQKERSKNQKQLRLF